MIAGDAPLNGTRDKAWPHVANMLLGLWLIASPPALGPESAALAVNDLACGVIVIAFSALAIRRSWAAWAVCLTGLWLMSAPLVFWARTAAAYNNDTLIGALLVALAVVVPRIVQESESDGLPPGWSYNPSGWAQRLGIVFLAMVGFFLARYMAAFQLDHISDVWEPFFGAGTRNVLTSDISKAFPVSDAGLGALSYLIDALAGLIGGPRRWRTMPWIVALFGFLIIPPGVTSIVLVILQPVGVGDWCTLCLATAVVMLLMVPPALDEVIASGQFLARTRREGGSLWRAFWRGEGSSAEDRAPSRRSFAKQVVHGIEVFSAPWNLLLSALVGVWFMAMPSILDVGRPAATQAHIGGALIATFAVIAAAEPARIVRFLNVPLGLWLALAPWVVSGGGAPARWSSIAAGLGLILLSLRRGPIEDRYGGWERWMR